MARPRRVYSKAFVPALMRQKFLDLLYESSKSSTSSSAAALTPTAAPSANDAASGVTLAGFREAYHIKYGEDLLHSKFGFDSVRSMLASLPGLIKLTG